VVFKENPEVKLGVARMIDDSGVQSVSKEFSASSAGKQNGPLQESGPFSNLPVAYAGSST
jgi:hypothetical protein